MSKMNTLEELEFLLELQNQSMGISTHDDVEIYCKMFEKAEDKTDGLEAEIEINIRRINFKETGSYIKTMFYEAKMPDAVINVIIDVFKKAIEDRIIRLREKAMETLGINKETKTESAYDPDSKEGGTGNYEIDN